MTDRYNGFVVVLKDNMREDDAQATINALKMIRGVIDVRPVPATSIHEAIAESRVKREIGDRLWAALHGATNQ